MAEHASLYVAGDVDVVVRIGVGGAGPAGLAGLADPAGLVIRPRFTPPDTPRRTVLRESADGIRVALRAPGLTSLLLLVAAAAGFVIPATSLLVPLIARHHHWTATVAVLIVGAQAAGGILIALIIARRGVLTARPSRRAGPSRYHCRRAADRAGPGQAPRGRRSNRHGAGHRRFRRQPRPGAHGCLAPQPPCTNPGAAHPRPERGPADLQQTCSAQSRTLTSGTGAMFTCAATVSACALTTLLTPAIRNARAPGRSPSSC